MINYILQNNLYHKDYVRLYTNGPFLLNTDFKMPGELDGVFSGYDPKKRKYNKKAWDFQKDSGGVVKKDFSMTDPFCVLQLMKKHYSRYDLDKVSSITGRNIIRAMTLIKYLQLPEPRRTCLRRYIRSTGQRANRTGLQRLCMQWAGLSIQLAHKI
jgi:anaerobic selenocysteine-containing dehydrogenase